MKKSVVPMLRRELGKNLGAIAVDGSYARREDKGFSDLELMIFVRESAKIPRGFSKTYDGLLIEEEHRISNSCPLEGEDRGGGYPSPRSTQ